jgi:hypothetical protein
VKTLVGALGYEQLPPELTFALTRRVGQLIAALDEPDQIKAVKLAEDTRWDADASTESFAITYFPTVPGVSPPWTVRLSDVWTKMLREFVYALRAHYRHQSATKRKLILRWQDNWGNSVTPPEDADKCREVIEEVIPVGTLVIMVKFNKWSVVKADAQRVYVGPGPYGPAYEDVTDRVTKALEEESRPREDYR